jgi:hypothetical protein
LIKALSPLSVGGLESLAVEGAFLPLYPCKYVRPITNGERALINGGVLALGASAIASVAREKKKKKGPGSVLLLLKCRRR